jgi:hypothetical protein
MAKKKEKQPSQITLKVIGKTVASTIDGKLLKTSLDKDDKDKLKGYVEKYNKSFSDYWKKLVVKMLTPDVKPIEEKEKAKTTKKLAAKKVKTAKVEIKKAKVSKAKKEAIGVVVSQVENIAETKQAEATTLEKVVDVVKETTPEPVKTQRSYGREW